MDTENLRSSVKKYSKRKDIPPILGINGITQSSNPILLESLSHQNIVFISSGWDHCYCISNEHNVYGWGSSINLIKIASYGKLGISFESNVHEPQLIEGLSSLRLVFIAAGYHHSAGLTSKINKET